MTKFWKILVAVALVIATVALFTPGQQTVQITQAPSQSSLGGSTSDNWSVGGTLSVTGATTLTGALTQTGAATLSSTLAVSGATTLSGTLSYLELTEAITASNTITASESGTVYYISGASSTSTLPAVATATGTVFTFVVSAALSDDITVVSAEGDNIEGAVDVNSSIVTVDAADRVLFAGSAENLGDTITIRSDGQKWFVSGTALNASGLSSDG